MSEQSESEKSESKKSPDAADVSEMNKSTAAAEQQQQQSTTTTNDMTVSSATKAEPSSEQQPQQSMVEKSKSITENIPVDESQQQQQPIDGQISQKSVESEKDEQDDSDKKSMAADLDASPSKTSTEQRSTTGTSSRGPIMRRRRKGEKVTEKNIRIGFIGAGKMTEVIVKGLLEVTPADGSERINPKQIFVSSKSGKTHDHFKRLGCYVTKRSYDIFGRMDCDMIFMAVHGFVIRQCYKSGGIRPLALTTNFIPNQRHPLYILSLIGGISLNDIKRTLLNPDHPEKYRVEMHRIMLNPSVAYGLGIGGIDVEPDSKQCSGLIRNILCRICRLETINESHMDIACAAGGYGSTFCYYFMAAIADGAFKRGLPKNLATKIAARTLQSAAASILESGKNPNDLRDSCASPSGPAIYGLHVLDKADCASGFAAAVEAAYQRIKELSENPPT